MSVINWAQQQHESIVTGQIVMILVWVYHLSLLCHPWNILWLLPAGTGIFSEHTVTDSLKGDNLCKQFGLVTGVHFKKKKLKIWVCPHEE